MDNGEKLIVLKNMISQYAQSQFILNGATMTEASLVMEAVMDDFRERAMRDILMNRVSIDSETENTEEMEKDGDSE